MGAGRVSRIAGVRVDADPWEKAPSTGIRWASRSRMRWMKIAPTTEEPTAPPIWRKKLFVAVAVPTTRTGNEFCTMSTSTCMTRPSPKPMRNRLPPMTAVDVSGVRVDIRPSAAATSAMPTTGYHL